MKSHAVAVPRFLFLALFVWMLGGIALAQLPKSTKNTGLNKELEIFGSVIEDSLTQKGVVKGLPPGAGRTYGIQTGAPAGAPGFIGRSPFDWNIRCQYVPTVGVIYMIPVSFPLVNPEAEKEGPEPSDTKEEEPDLWEKHEKGVQEGRQPGAALTPGMMYGMMEMFSPGELGPGANRSAGAPGDPFGPEMRPMGLGGPPAPVYDPEAVKSLRVTLIEVLAQYGHRLEDLPEDEQILFVVTSSSASAVRFDSVFIRSGEGEEGTEILLPGAAAKSGSRDQYLLSINKADVTAKRAPEEIEDKLTERVF